MEVNPVPTGESGATGNEPQSPEDDPKVRVLAQAFNSVLRKLLEQATENSNSGA